MRFGPEIGTDGVTFRLWAPAAKRVDLVLDGIHPMTALPGGWYEGKARGGAGTRYEFLIDGDVEVPDPGSHFQPEDVLGPSEVIDHTRFPWQAAAWNGRPWTDAVFLELHVGTFTPAGTFRAAIDKLDHVVAAGFTAIELMPLADFAGRRNWGYDGVLLYAPDSAYGRPDDLKALIDAAHLRGLMVFLDVVYNHFGPEGNFLHRYAPNFFTAAQTPWGAAIDYRVPDVRAFAIENALHWLENYRFDGLRLDAVHAIGVPDEPSVLEALSRAAGALAAATDRHIHLVLENDDNRAALLDPMTDPPAGRYRAQWNDDYHHAWHVLLTAERQGYYEDYGDPLPRIVRTLSSGFDYQGEVSVHRGGRRRGEPSGALPPAAFVNFLQNHDQIGNRPRGDRLSTLAPAAAIEAATAITLLAPMPPLMFMGEEWGTTRPFPFFCDFHGELAEAVRRGRRAEFKSAYESWAGEIPDALCETTFLSAKLDWEALAGVPAQARLDLVRRLLTVRAVEIVPHLAGARFRKPTVESADTAIMVGWRLGNGTGLHLLANVAAKEIPKPVAARGGRPIWGGMPPGILPPWSVFWSVGAD